jgi:hypothetical protein
MHPQALYGPCLLIGWYGSTRRRGAARGMVVHTYQDEAEDLKIPYCALTLKEAVYLLTHHCEGYFDAGTESVVLTE